VSEHMCLSELHVQGEQCDQAAQAIEYGYTLFQHAVKPGPCEVYAAPEYVIKFNLADRPSDPLHATYILSRLCSATFFDALLCRLCGHVSLVYTRIAEGGG
jgi:hypothetical protein